MSETLEPVWIVVRATVSQNEGGLRLLRDQIATVDANWPRVKVLLQAGLIVPVPANQQPPTSYTPEAQ